MEDSMTNEAKVVEEKKENPTPELALLKTLEKLKPQLRDALPRSMDADRFARVVMTEVRKTPRLLECQPASFLAAVFTAAQIGLEIGSHLGEAFVVPFRNNRAGRTDATLIIGYKGLVKLMWESEQIASLSDVIVHAKDAIEYKQGDEESILHRPFVPPVELLAKLSTAKVQMTDAEKEALDPGPAIAYYAIIETKGGGRRRAFMWASDAVRHRDAFARNATKEDSVWRTNFDAMALKTVIRRAAKLAPRSIEKPSLQQAIALDELAEAGVEQGLALPAGSEAVVQPSGLSLAAFATAETVSAEDDAKPPQG
jgi:recombination protein RecT